MKPYDEEGVEPAEALIVSSSTDEAGDDALVCSLCGGPSRLCGGTRNCPGGPESMLDQRWLAAIRAVYAGLLLTRTPAALWGGALLRMARQLAAGALALDGPPAGILTLAAEYADPGCAGPSDVAAGLALVYLQHGDLDRLSELSKSLREARAPWLSRLAGLGPQAAWATPLDRERFALLAVLCDDCARKAPPDAIPPCAPADTYDAAIRCPRCGALPAHPLPGVRLGEPHPVGRCVAVARSSSRSCLVHEGYELDAEGLCVEGRATFDQALSEAAKIASASTPFERDLVDALVRARRRALSDQLDDAAIARSLVTSPELMPFFAALAATDPGAGRDLAQIAGAPLDTDAADPIVRAAMSRSGGLAGMIASGKAALEGLRASLFGKPPERTALAPRRKRRQRKARDR